MSFLSGQKRYEAQGSNDAEAQVATRLSQWLVTWMVDGDGAG
jgi:hypothetical protein